MSMSEHPTAALLVEVAARIVDRDGVDGLTVRRLVEESGISVGSLYHHVGDIDGLLERVRAEALAEWSGAFTTALGRGGLVAAYEAEGRWRREHPGVAELVDRAGRTGALGEGAVRFGEALRAWLDEQDLARGAPAAVVAALVLGPLLELRRLEGALGRRTTRAELAATAAAVEAGLASIGARSR